MTLPYNNATVSTYKALCTSENDTEEMLLVLVMSSVSYLSLPPIRRRPSGEFQLTWEYLGKYSTVYTCVTMKPISALVGGSTPIPL